MSAVAGVLGTIIQRFVVATIAESSPRYADWVAVFGSNRCPLETSVPVVALLPGYPMGVLVYKLDIAALDSEQRDRLCRHLAVRFGESAQEAQDCLDLEGCPVLACDVCVISHTLWLPGGAPLEG